MVHLTRRYAYTVALVQLCAGLSGIILGASHFAGVSYKPATKLLSFLPGAPSAWWSGLLATLALAAILVLRFHNDSRVRSVFALLTGYWVFWALLWTAAWFQKGPAGPWAPWLALMCVVGNSRPVLTATLAEH